MKLNLRDILPLDPKAKQACFEAFATDNSPEATEDGFQKFFKALEANEVLQKYRMGEKKPTSISLLVDKISAAIMKSRTELAKMISVDLKTWEALLSNKVEPYIITPDKYSKLGRIGNLGYSVLQEAISGTYKLFQVGATENVIMFARSDQRASRQTTASKNIKAAFEEMKIKLGEKKKEQSSDTKINNFLSEVQRCMNQA